MQKDRAGGSSTAEETKTAVPQRRRQATAPQAVWSRPIGLGYTILCYGEWNIHEMFSELRNVENPTLKKSDGQTSTHTVLGACLRIWNLLINLLSITETNSPLRVMCFFLWWRLFWATSAFPGNSFAFPRSGLHFAFPNNPFVTPLLFLRLFARNKQHT